MHVWSNKKHILALVPPHKHPFFLSQFLQLFHTERNQNDLRVLSSIVVTSFTRTKPNIFIAQNLDCVPYNDALQNVFLNNMFKTIQKVFIDMMASKSNFWLAFDNLRNFIPGKSLLLSLYGYYYIPFVKEGCDGQPNYAFFLRQCWKKVKKKKKDKRVTL